MNIQHLITESELETQIQQFGFPVEEAEKECLRHLQIRWTSSRAELERRAADVQTLTHHPETLQQTLEVLKTIRPYEQIIQNHTTSETSQTAEEQIFFSGASTKPLNHIPYLVTLFVFLKVYIAPGMALLMPLVLAIMPYFIMTTVMGTQIPWDTYVQMMKQMAFGIQSGEPWRLKHIAQVGWFFVSLGQGMIQPFFTAYHTRKLDAKICERGEAVLQIANTTRKILEDWRAKGAARTWTLQVPDVPQAPREAVAWMEAEPLGWLAVKRCFGYVGMMATFAASARWRPVAWSNRGLAFKDLCDIAVLEKDGKRSTLALENHSMVTGPNRGGKSSALRAVLQQVLLGQTFGLTYKATGSWRPFQLLFSRLKSKDHAGKESLFEMEVRMAATMLKTTKSTEKHSLVLIDELFHSTNPPDAEISAKLFLQQLWGLTNVKSMISTHIFSLCEMPQKPQMICVPAEEGADGQIQYSYKLAPGICRVSSVREVLKEHGLV
jgi:hypothetical protein